METAMIDMYAEQLSDLFDECANTNDVSALNETWARNLKFFERQLATNRNGFLVGSSLSWADIYLAQMVEFIDEHIRRELMVKFPHVRIQTSKVREIPLIADWIRRRPITDG